MSRESIATTDDDYTVVINVVSAIRNKSTDEAAREVAAYRELAVREAIGRKRDDRFFVSGQMLLAIEHVEREPERHSATTRCLAAGLRRAIEKDTRVSREEAFTIVEAELRAIGRACVTTGDHDRGGSSIWDHELGDASLMGSVDVWKKATP